MEDDDEFGDLYTDVLRPFSSSSALQSQEQPSRPQLDTSPIESLASTHAGAANSGNELCAPFISNSSSNPNFSMNININPDPNRDRFPTSQKNEPDFDPSRVSRDSPPPETQGIPGISVGWSSDSPHAEASETRVLQSPDLNRVAEAAATESERRKESDQSVYSNEDNSGLRVEQEDDALVKPGISIAQPNDVAQNSDIVVQGEVNGQVDDWESDSEDDLQILVNDNHHPDINHLHGPMFVDGNAGKVGDDDDEDEDGDPLVIVSDTDAVHHPPQEEQGWGEDAAGQATDGERKEPGEAGKANGGASLAQKAGYNNFGYHPFHSQFKYVRPGAGPLPGGSGGSAQVRPPVNLGVVGGRGRGDWRPSAPKGASLQKGYSGFWGGSASGRGGDFTLPSQKTIFDIDFESFEEKPWKYPGADISDFFNFSMNEDSWKEYCKQLEHLRFASTMKSKAHVLVVDSRNEQEHDPDMPPELAAAAANQNPLADNSNAQKADIGQSDAAKEAPYIWPPLSNSRPIPVQVESGSDRLPSIDTRLSRTRDSDAVIVILQETPDDDSSAGYGAAEPPDNNDVSRKDFRDDTGEDDEQIGNNCSDGYPQSLDRTRKGENLKRLSRGAALRNNEMAEGSSPPPEASTGHFSGSRENSPRRPSDKFEATHKERRMDVKAHDASHPTSPRESALDDNLEESNESMEGKVSPIGVSSEEKVLSDNEPSQTEGFNLKQNGDDSSDGLGSGDSVKRRSMKKPKLGSQVEQFGSKDIDDTGCLKAARSSDNSRATESSRDHQKGLDNFNEEVTQDEYSSHARDLRRNPGERVQFSSRKGRDGSTETEKNSMLMDRRESSYQRRDRDPYSPHTSVVKPDGYDRRKERDYADSMLQHRGEDPYGRKCRPEDSRKPEHADATMLRHREIPREGERSGKDDHLLSRKTLENGNWRGYREKDAGYHDREKEDILKTRYENVGDPHSKRRKGDEHARRDHVDKDEILRAHRENSIQRKSVRDESLDQRKRDDQHRRENVDDHRSVRAKDEGWLQRERVERHREKDDWHRSKQSYEDSLSRREREDGRASIRSGRNLEDKGWMGHSRKDEYKGYEKDNSYNDTGRNGDQPKRKDRVEDASSLQSRGSEDARKDQSGYEEKRSRQDKVSVQSDRAVHASGNRRGHERRPKESLRKAKEHETGLHGTSSSSKRPQEERGGRHEMAGVGGTNEERNADGVMSKRLQINRERAEDVLSDDEHHSSRRGRSKMERWTSHNEREFNTNPKQSSSSKPEAEKNNSLGAGHSTKTIDEPSKRPRVLDSSHSATEGKPNATVQDEKEADAKPMENQHMDTAAKLKKRSERFKLPMPSEKDTAIIKKMESEPLSSAPSEAPPNSETKQERPARKRRWVSK